MGFLVDNRVEVLRLTLEHVVLCAVSLGIAVIVAVPLGVGRHGRARRIGVGTGVTGVRYTVPSLGVVAVGGPVVGVGGVRSGTGRGR